jgi:translocation and assembly module TamA
VISIRINGREVADIGPFDRITRIDTLVYDVRTGPAFSFGTVAIGPLAPGDSLPEDVAQGQPARVSALEGAVSGALRGWRARAHPKPRVTDERVAADNSAATLSATYRIEPGRTATFGRIGVTGANTVRESRVLQIAGIRSGKRSTPKSWPRRSGACARPGRSAVSRSPKPTASGPMARSTSIST